MDEILDAEHLARLIESGDREAAKKYVIEIVTKEAESSDEASLNVAKALAYMRNLNSVNQNYADFLEEIEKALIEIKKAEGAELDKIDLEEARQKIADS